VNFELGDGMLRIVGAAVGPVDGASDDGGILTNAPKTKIHAVGGSPTGINKWTGSSFTGRNWGRPLARAADANGGGHAVPDAQTRLEHRRQSQHGSQAAAIVLQTLSDAEKQPDIKVKTMLGRNALDHNLIWDEKSISLAQNWVTKVTFGLNSELWSPRVVRGKKCCRRSTVTTEYRAARERSAEGGLTVHFEGGKPDEPPMWRAQRFITRVARYATRSERGAAASGNLVWARSRPSPGGSAAPAHDRGGVLHRLKKRCWARSKRASTPTWSC
jgi:hypothetical protein